MYSDLIGAGKQPFLKQEKPKVQMRTSGKRFIVKKAYRILITAWVKRQQNAVGRNITASRQKNTKKFLPFSKKGGYNFQEYYILTD